MKMEKRWEEGVKPFPNASETYYFYVNGNGTRIGKVEVADYGKLLSQIVAVKFDARNGRKKALGRFSSLESAKKAVEKACR